MIPTLRIKAVRGRKFQEGGSRGSEGRIGHLVLKKLGHWKKKWHVQKNCLFCCCCCYILKNSVPSKEIGVFLIGRLWVHIVSCVFYHILSRSNANATVHKNWDLKNNYKGMIPIPHPPSFIHLSFIHLNRDGSQRHKIECKEGHTEWVTKGTTYINYFKRHTSQRLMSTHINGKI